MKGLMCSPIHDVILFRVGVLHEGVSRTMLGSSCAVDVVTVRRVVDE